MAVCMHARGQGPPAHACLNTHAHTQRALRRLAKPARRSPLKRTWLAAHHQRLLRAERLHLQLPRQQAFQRGFQQLLLTARLILPCCARLSARLLLGAATFQSRRRRPCRTLGVHAVKGCRKLLAHRWQRARSGAQRRQRAPRGDPGVRHCLGQREAAGGVLARRAVAQGAGPAR